MFGLFRRQPERVGERLAARRTRVWNDAQRQGQSFLAQRRHEPRASFSPKRTFDEEAQPPLAPPFQRAAVNLKNFAQPLHALELQSVDHGRHQHHDQAGINAPSSAGVHVIGPGCSRKSTKCRL